MSARLVLVVVFNDAIVVGVQGPDDEGHGATTAHAGSAVFATRTALVSARRRAAGILRVGREGERAEHSGEGEQCFRFHTFYLFVFRVFVNGCKSLIVIRR